MRHRVRGRKLGRTSAPRRALIRGLARAIILNEEGRIVTTIAKAKEMRPFLEKLVTLSRDDQAHKRRRAVSLLNDTEAVEKLFAEIGPRYLNRPGGYTRILRLDKRLGDKAEKAMVEFVLEADVVPDDDSAAASTVFKPESNSGSGDTSKLKDNKDAPVSA